MMMNRILRIFFLSLLLYPLTLRSQPVPVNLTLEEIFHEPVLPGIRPEFEFFSGDQTAIFFAWNDSSFYETGFYTTGLDGSMEFETADDETPRPVHSPDGSRIAYIRDGDLFVSRADGSGEQNLVSTPEEDLSGLKWSPGGEKLAFEMNGEIWTTRIDTPEVTRIITKDGDEPGFTLDAWIGSDRFLVRQTDHSGSRTVYFPEYVDEFVEPGADTRGIPEVTLLAVPSDTTAPDTLMTGVHRSSTDVSADGRYVAVDYADAALKHRRLIVHDFREKTRTVVFEDSTDGWLHHTYSAFAPGGSRLMFLSEQSGWNHIYTVNADGTGFEQHTSGEYYISWARWIDDNSIVYANNREDYGERHIYTLDLATGTTYKWTEEPAYRYRFQLSPDRSTLVYAKTFFNRPYDLYRLDLTRADDPSEVQLTRSVPDRFYDFDWQRERYVRFTGRDGTTKLSMSVLCPAGFEETGHYPVVVFAHGAGSLQNVYKGWSNNYWREYMFHQYLLNHGYVVVEVDFRHSTGYGRKFREDVTNRMGKYETQDIIDGLDWLQNDCGGCLDLKRTGIYGGSYGGFMALYAVSQNPGRFHAAAALRKVANWRNYYHANPWYTLPRLGDPDEVPEHYDRSSPLTYAGELNRPVLLLHGLIDDNVGVQDAFQYADKLIESGNTDFDMMIYPSERHGFTNPFSWYDEYLRIFEFFEEHLK